MKIAGAPISWGVCEVPGWGFQLEPERVLTEMREIGLTACEFGPQGWLPEDPAGRAKIIADYGLEAVGAFVPVLLHDPNHDPLPEVDKELDAFEAAGGKMLNLAAFTGTDGYDDRPVLDDEGWQTMFTNLDRLVELASRRGFIACLHPHVGTMVEQRDEVYKVLENSTIPLCLDTGHLLIGGTDAAELTDEWAHRVALVHAKDVNAAKAKKVQDGEWTYTEAVRNKVYVPLGEGDVDYKRIVENLNKAGYDGWYVLEQDLIIDEEPAAGEGPVHDVKKCIAFLEALA